jgi:CRISPR/Cas system Type II protein with McrA/HNH and RuvC-like nuclease domain
MVYRKHINDNIKSIVYKNQRGVCNLCKNELEIYKDIRFFDLDHIVPYSISYNNDVLNLQYLCLKPSVSSTKEYEYMLLL